MIGHGIKDPVMGAVLKPGHDVHRDLAVGDALEAPVGIRGPVIDDVLRMPAGKLAPVIAEDVHLKPRIRQSGDIGDINRIGNQNFCVWHCLLLNKKTPLFRCGKRALYIFFKPVE